jgi:hypothetical protein
MNSQAYTDSARPGLEFLCGVFLFDETAQLQKSGANVLNCYPATITGSNNTQEHLCAAAGTKRAAGPSIPARVRRQYNKLQPLSVILLDSAASQAMRAAKNKHFVTPITLVFNGNGVQYELNPP